MIPFGEHPVDAELHSAMLDTADELIRLTGAGICEWNGTIDSHEMKDADGDAAALGKAHWNGTISLREDLLATLRDLWQQSPRAWAKEDRARQQPGVLTVAHELTHYLVPAGERYANGKPYYDEFPGRAMEEGLTELAGRRHVSAFAGAEARSPGTADARNARSYPQFVQAAHAVVRYVSELRGESEDAVLNALVRENVPGKFRRLSQMVLEARGTWDQIPTAERDAARGPIINAVWGAFQANRDWAAAKPRDRPTRAPEARSSIMGLQVIAATERARLQAADRYGPEKPKTPWQIAAAQYEYDLASNALAFFQSSRHQDVAAAAGAWMQRATQRVEDASQELQPRPEPVQHDRPGRDPEMAAVPCRTEPPRRRPRFRVGRRPDRWGPGRDR